MSPVSIYRSFSRILRLSYRSKFLIAVLLGAYVPVAAAIVYVVGFEAPPGVLFRVFGAVVFMVLVGAVLTLLLLIHLLKPISVASRTLRSYVADGLVPELPTDLRDDEAGHLLAEAHRTIRQMDKTFRHLSDFDQVTGLPNHKSFERSLSQRMASGMPFALCAIGLSNYDRITSALGQHAVDLASNQLAQGLLETLEAETQIARISARAFLFELDLSSGEDFLTTRVEEIRLKMQRDASLAAYNVYPELTAGISIFHGQDVDAGRLIDEAISAMAETGGAAEGKTQIFSPTHALAAREALLIERDLREAVALNQLSLHYQPLVDLVTGRVCGAEALVRWNHPERGAVSPALFIPIAEKSGLVDEIGLWILSETCRQLGAWSTTEFIDLKISMNLSVRQFLRPHVVSLILEALTASAVDPWKLEVELTETAMIEDHARTRQVLEEFRSKRITTAIDDFGAGFSSLTYLKTMPFNRIKIDREFIRDVEKSSKSSAICRALIELAKGLEIEVLAEGTETKAEVQHLQELGCTLFQGYYFSRPVPADKFADAVREAEAKMRLHTLTSPSVSSKLIAVACAS